MITENVAQLDEIIEESAEKKATYLCQKTAPATDRRMFIPMYEKDDTMKLGSVDEKHKLIKSQVFEINYKGETIFVRKSTIVWLL